jgi:predicted ATPase
MSEESGPHPRITRLRLAGFRSIGEAELELRPINVLIGPNGSGKSNLVGSFRMLSHMMTREPRLQEYVGRTGGASDLLTDGPAATPQLSVELVLRTEKGANEYAFRLFHAAPDRLVFAEERFRYLPEDHPPEERKWFQIEAAGRTEPQIQRLGEEGNRTARVIHGLLGRCKVFQFHDTSAQARIRQYCPAHDNHYLREDGANLAAFLLRMAGEHPAHYREVVANLRAILPFFDDFELEPEASGAIMLKWREQGADTLFAAHQASDGMLRAMALVALLCQPAEWLPGVVVIDEPELGLHPRALDRIADLAATASRDCQILMATQSPDLLATFEAEDILIAERQGRHSHFRRVGEDELEQWLGDYSAEGEG